MRSEEEIEALMEAEREYKERVLPEVWRRIEELKQEVPQEFQREARIAYLKDQMADAVARMWQLPAEYEDYHRRDKVLEGILVMEEYEQAKKRMDRLLGEIRRLNGKDQARPREITPEMIEQAREYPFEELYEFKRGMAVCPFHNDKSPSLSLKGNRAKCFGCGWTGDTIDFVMAREGLKFPDAVRALGSIT